MPVAFRFESPTDDFTGVLQGSPVGSGPIASQDAGSTNPYIYYRVGGGGVNGRFAAALRPQVLGGPDELARVNAALAAAYDQKYGAGAHAADQAAGRADRLTSLCVPLQHQNTRVAPEVAAMVYSVGPVLRGPAPGAPEDAPLISNGDAYRAIYTDALEASSGLDVARFRITMVSTGIYAGALRDVADKRRLFAESAGLILSAFERSGVPLPGMVLVNNGRVEGLPLIREGFTAAAQQNPACTMVTGGFDLAV